ncbi:MAG: hypothetical protein EOO43_01680 [Flavobacterium sp.]|nr:MAG: hypothetical protein EOO43_01680 [Flavobacterium sp.]
MPRFLNLNWSICGVGGEFNDYWDLNKHPLYILADKKFKAPYMKYDEEHFANSTKVDSLTAVRRYLDKVEWTGEPKYSKEINRAIQSH